MSDFNLAIEYVLPHEGGYVNDKSDPGGETNYGISKRSYPDLNIRDLTKEQAISIYFKDYWLRHHLPDIASQLIASKLFDMIVNLGPTRAITMIQIILIEFGHDLKADGIIGHLTTDAINLTDPNALFKELIDDLQKYYNNLVKKNPALQRYIKGWTKRALSVPHVD